MMETIPLVRESEVADDRVREAFRDIKQLLRVPLVSTVFAAYAAVPRFLDFVWRRMRPSVLTPPFAERAKKIADTAQRGVTGWAVQDHAAEQAARNVAESDVRKMREIVNLFTQLDPVLAILTNAVALGLAGEEVGGAGSPGLPKYYEKDKLMHDFRGAPLTLIDERDAPLRVRTVYEGIKKATRFPFIIDDHRAMGAFPDWLEVWWKDVKPLVGDERWAALCREVAEAAVDGARHLPYHLQLAPPALERHGIDEAQRLPLARSNRAFCDLLPGVIVGIAVARRGLGPEAA